MAYDLLVLRVWLVTLLGCGRIAFDASQDATGMTDGTFGHDEDGDGVPDASDVCPHLADSQLDGDGDRVGDDCDPNPTEPRDSIAVFATLQPGDQPWQDIGSDGEWLQHADSIEFVGVPDTGDRYTSASLTLQMPVADARIVIGFDIHARFEGEPQNQFALGIITTPPHYYVELNESPAEADATVTYYDGSGFFQRDPQPIPLGIRTGAVFFQGTFVVGSEVRFDANWPGEAYVSRAMEPQYQGGDYAQINVNNLLVEIRYLCVIHSS